MDLVFPRPSLRDPPSWMGALMLRIKRAIGEACSGSAGLCLLHPHCHHPRQMSLSLPYWVQRTIRQVSPQSRRAGGNLVPRPLLSAAAPPLPPLRGCSHLPDVPGSPLYVSVRSTYQSDRQLLRQTSPRLRGSKQSSFSHTSQCGWSERQLRRVPFPRLTFPDPWGSLSPAPMGRRADGQPAAGLNCELRHFCPHPIGQKMDTWPLLTARSNCGPAVRPERK